MTGCNQPPIGYTELPTCQSCLTRMDAKFDGLITITFDHASKKDCLKERIDPICRVCHYIETPELVETSICMECKSIASLWICLIYGHIGCAWHQGGHAPTHYEATGHTHALQFGTNRVWNFRDDHFVRGSIKRKNMSDMSDDCNFDVPLKRPMTSDLSKPLGLRNLINTCYLNSIIQGLFATKRYVHASILKSEIV